MAGSRKPNPNPVSIARSFINYVSVGAESRKDLRILEFCARTEDGNVLLGRSTMERACSEIEIHAPSSEYSPHDMRNVAMTLPKDRYPIGALLLLRIAFSYMQALPHSEALPLLRHLIYDVESVTLALHGYHYVGYNKRRSLAESYGISLLREILRWLRSFPRHDDVIMCRAKCKIALSSVHNDLGLPEAAFQFATEGIGILQVQFRGLSNKHKYFGMLHYQIGLALYTKAEYTRSAESLTETLQAFDEALDFFPEEKREWIRVARSLKERADRISAGDPNLGF